MENFYNLVKSNKGSSSVIIICTTVIILIAAALVTDVAYGAVQRFKLLKGAKDVARLGAAELSKNRAEAEKVMKGNAVKKVNDLNLLDIKISDSNREITVAMGKPFEYIFLGYAGFEKRQLKESITARLSGMAEFKGIRPFAIEKQEFKYGRDYTLINAQSGMMDSISFQQFNPGEGDFKSTILFGYRKTLKVGSGIYPLRDADQEEALECLNQLVQKCRHKPICRFDNYQPDCSKIMVLPVVERLEKEEQKAMVIVGFTVFFMESVYRDNQSINIKGRFIKYTVDSKTNDAAPDFGLIGVELIH